MHSPEAMKFKAKGMAGGMQLASTFAQRGHPKRGEQLFCKLF